MTTPTRHTIDSNLAFGFLSLIDVDKIRQSVTDDWLDEFFFVVDGRLIIDLEDRTVEFLPTQGFTIPKGVLHRTRAPVRTAMLMVEGRTVSPIGMGDPRRRWAYSSCSA